MKLFSVFNSKQLKTATIGSLAVKFLSAFFALVNGILLARLLTKKELGIYVLAFTTVSIISIPVSLGLPSILTRNISKYIVSKHHSLIKGMILWSNKIAGITILLTYFITALLYWFWWHRYSEPLVNTFLISFLLLPLLVLGSLRSAALRGLKFIILGQLPDTFFRNLFLSIFLFSTYFFNYSISPQKTMLYHSIAAGISFIIGFFFLQIKLKKTIQNSKPEFQSKVWLKESVPFSITSGIQVIKSKFITYILAVFGSIEAVAVFDVAQRGATLVSFTLDALNTAISPYISSSYEENKKEYLQSIITKTARIIFILSMPLALLFIIFGKTILEMLFGAEFVVAYIPLVILCIGQIANSLAGSVGVILNMTGNQRYVTKIQIYMLFINILISIPLVLFLDVIGASIAISFIVILQNILLVLHVKRKLHINPTVF